MARLTLAGVSKAISNVNDIIAPALLKSAVDLMDQRQVDTFLIDLDGTANKGRPVLPGLF